MLKVLLIDPDVQDSNQISRFLITGSDQVELQHLFTPSSVEAFLTIHSSATSRKVDIPAFIILDVDFPDAETGLSLLKQIKSNRHFKNIPVFVFTNNSDKDIVAHAYVHGANGYFLKPGERSHLPASIKMLTERWQQIIQRGFGFNYQAV